MMGLESRPPGPSWVLRALPDVREHRPGRGSLALHVVRADQLAQAGLEAFELGCCGRSVAGLALVGASWRSRRISETLRGVGGVSVGGRRFNRSRSGAHDIQMAILARWNTAISDRQKRGWFCCWAVKGVRPLMPDRWPSVHIGHVTRHNHDPTGRTSPGLQSRGLAAQVRLRLTDALARRIVATARGRSPPRADH